MGVSNTSLSALVKVMKLVTIPGVAQKHANSVIFG